LPVIHRFPEKASRTPLINSALFRCSYVNTGNSDIAFPVDFGARAHLASVPGSPPLWHKELWLFNKPIRSQRL
jgi:hypothetical protein